MSDHYQKQLSKARGWGATGAGTRSWWNQRLTSIALLPLTLWFLFSLALQPSLSASAVGAWIAHPLNSVLLIALILIACWHMLLGLRVIAEDYVHSGTIKVGLLVALDLFVFALVVSAIWAIVKISFAAF